MDPVERADRSADCETVVPATEVDLGSLATLVAHLEPPRVDESTSPEPEAEHEELDECVDADENSDQSPTRQSLALLVSPHTMPGPQDEISPQVYAELDSDDVSVPPRINKGKQPMRVHYSKDFAAIDVGLLEAPLPLSDNPPLPDISSIHLDDDLSHSTKPNKGIQPQQVSHSSDFVVTDAGSSTTPPPALRGPGNPPVSTAGLAHGQPIPWELDPERPAQKLPIRLKDVLGRTMLIPWRIAKTWEGMKMTIDAQFQPFDGEGLDIPLLNAVANGRYNLYVSLPSSVEPPKRKSSSKNNSSSNSNRNSAGGNNNSGPAVAGMSEGSRTAGGSSSNNNLDGQFGKRNNTATNYEAAAPPRRPVVPEAPSSHMRAMILLPEFWDELIQPGSHVSMTMRQRLPRSAFDVPVPGIHGLPPTAPGIGMTNPPGGIMPPMAPPHPRFIRVIDLNRGSRPKTRAKSGRPRRMI